MLMNILLMVYDVTNGIELYTPTNLSSVADAISLQCMHGLTVWSRLELATICYGEASCLGFGTDKKGTSSFFCACPKQITWPGSWNISSIHLHYITEPLTGITMWFHYCDVIMGAMASQITSLTIVYSTVYSGADQRKHQNSASLAFVRGINRWPVSSPHKGPVTLKMIPFDDVIMVMP